MSRRMYDDFWIQLALQSPPQEGTVQEYYRHICHYSQRVAYSAVLHGLAVVGLYRLLVQGQCMLETLVWTLILLPLCELGWTVGAHRYWAHHSFQASWVVRLMLMLCQSMAHQGCLYDWVVRHRLHCKYRHSWADPHCYAKSLFLGNQPPTPASNQLSAAKNPQQPLHYSYDLHRFIWDAQRTLDCSDVWDDGLVQWQARWYPWISPYLAFCFPAQVAVHAWGESVWTAILVAGVLRHVVAWHWTHSWLRLSESSTSGWRTDRTRFVPPTTADQRSKSPNHTKTVAAVPPFHHHWSPSTVVLNGLQLLGLVWDVQPTRAYGNLVLPQPSPRPELTASTATPTEQPAGPTKGGGFGVPPRHGQTL